MTEKKFNPSYAFLRKVEAGQVYRYMGYSMQRGSYYGFRGGEITFDKHKAAGYCNIYGGASLGRSAVAVLTDKGREFLTSKGPAL